VFAPVVESSNMSATSVPFSRILKRPYRLIKDQRKYKAQQPRTFHSGLARSPQSCARCPSFCLSGGILYTAAPYENAQKARPQRST
jgi:hypothetical protein